MNPSGSAKTPTPEERLLRLIRGKGQEAKTKSVAAGPSGQTVAVMEAVEVQHSSRLPRAISALLGAVIIVEVALLIFNGLKPEPIIDLSNLESGSSERAQVLPQLRAVMRSHATKSLFTAPLAQAVTPSAVAVAPSVQASKLAARLTLLGIVSGEEPQAIIEDSQTQKTYFVSEGQAVVDGAIVESIGSNRIVLNFLGETIELNL